MTTALRGQIIGCMRAKHLTNVEEGLKVKNDEKSIRFRVR